MEVCVGRFEATFPEGGRPWGLGYLQVSPLLPFALLCSSVLSLPSPFSLFLSLTLRLTLSPWLIGTLTSLAVIQWGLEVLFHGGAGSG